MGYALSQNGSVNLSSDFDHSEKLLRFRSMAVFGVNNGILRIADLIKPCNQSGKFFIKNKPETRLSPEQRVWCGGWDLNPRRRSLFIVVHHSYLHIGAMLSI